MRLDLRCQTEADHKWKLGKNVFSLGCTERHRITLYYQQVRAFNLVYALKNKGLLEKDTKICILGAGPAGVAAASAAAILEAEVVLLEKEDDILGVLGQGCKQNKRRLFHPALDKWPNPAWLNNRTDLPLFNWEQPTNLETSPQDLRCQFLTELRGIQNCPRNKLRVLTGFQGQPEWKHGQWCVELGQCTESYPSTKIAAAPTTTFDAKILILAFGFGGDKNPEYPGSFGYFENDAKLWDQIDKLGVKTEPPSQDKLNAAMADILEDETPKFNSHSSRDTQSQNKVSKLPQIIVSGSGDGALIEAINAVSHSSTTTNGRQSEEPLNWRFTALVNLFEDKDYIPNWNDLRLKLQELEEIIDSQKFTSEEMLSRYEQLEECAQHKATLKKVDEELRGTFKARRKAYLFHKDRHFMGVGNFAFLRFLVWRFVSMGLILPRRIEMTPEIYKIWREIKGERTSCDLEFSSSGQQWKFPDIHFIIPRHGPSWPFSKQSNNYLHLEDAAKVLQGLNEEDKTREVIWDAAFTERLRTHYERGENP